MLVVLLGAALGMAGCAPDAICRTGEYPVIQIGGTGRACVADDDDPPAGYTRFPAGQAPGQGDDDWDLYWRTHTVDANGRTVTL